MVRIWTLEMRNGYWADANYFESELPFPEEDLENMHKPSE
jgi:hypothetical protein